MMQTAIVTYSNGHTELKPARIPMPPSGTLEDAFLICPFLHLRAEEAGFTYSWDVNGHVRMIDTNRGIMYEWIPKPTMVDALCNPPAGETYIFQTNGTVKLRTRPEPFSQPNLVWEHVWPANPETILIAGEEVDSWDEWEDYVTDYCYDNLNVSHALHSEDRMMDMNTAVMDVHESAPMEIGFVKIDVTDGK